MRRCSHLFCPGEIGVNARCNICHRVAKADPTPASAEPAPPSAEPEPDTVPIDLAERRLCLDGACVGVLQLDGRCPVCGRGLDPAAAAPYRVGRT